MPKQNEYSIADLLLCMAFFVLVFVGIVSGVNHICRMIGVSLF